MKLVYLYIGKTSRTLENIGINFSDSFQIAYQDKQLSITKNTNVVKIFGNLNEEDVKDSMKSLVRNAEQEALEHPVEELTAIVGRNGCGKTSILDLLFFSKTEEIKQIVGSEGGCFLLYFLENHGETGIFYMVEYTKTPFFDFDCTEKKGKFQMREYRLSYDYNTDQVQLMQLRGKQKDFFNDCKMTRISRKETVKRIKTSFLYHPVQKEYFWYQKPEYSDVYYSMKQPRYVDKYLVETSPYTLLSYLRSVTENYAAERKKSREKKQGKKEKDYQKSCKQGNAAAFESIPNGLRYKLVFSPEFIPVSMKRAFSHMNELDHEVDILTMDEGHRAFSEICESDQNTMKNSIGFFMMWVILKFAFIDFRLEYGDMEENDKSEMSYLEIDRKVQAFLEKNMRAGMSKTICRQIAYLLFQCSIFEVEKKSHKEKNAPEYVLAEIIALILAVTGEQYAEFIDKCFNESGLLKKKDPWRRIYDIIKIYDEDTKQFLWKNTIPKECLCIEDGMFCINIPVVAYDFAPDVKIGTRTEIMDSILKLVYILEKLDKGYYSSEIREKYLPKYQITGISTGELEFIDLISSIYGGLSKIYWNHPSPNLIEKREDTVILLLDEPDGTFHPEWSRKFVKTLSDTLASEPFVFYPCKYQIIFTTHSPILLSDIPSRNIRSIRVTADGHAELESTEYGLMSNINDIMIDSFFVSKPFGSFAEAYVERLMERIKGLKDMKGSMLYSAYDYSKLEKEKQEIIDGIELISEPYVKKVLFRALEKAENDNPEFKKKLIERQIQKLQDELRKMDGKE